MSFLAVPHCVKSKCFFGCYQSLPTSFLPCFPMTPSFNKNIYIHIELTLTLTMSIMYFFVFSKIVSNVFNFQCLGALYCPKQNKIKSNLLPLVLLHPFEHLPITFCHFVIPCQHSHLFVLLHLLLSLVLYRCVVFVDQT
jgi:hypothetical protein